MVFFERQLYQNTSPLRLGSKATAWQAGSERQTAAQAASLGTGLDLKGSQPIVSRKCLNFLNMSLVFTFSSDSVHSDDLTGLKVPKNISGDEFLADQSESKTALKGKFLRFMLVSPIQRVLDWQQGVEKGGFAPPPLKTNRKSLLQLLCFKRKRKKTRKCSLN